MRTWHDRSPQHWQQSNLPRCRQCHPSPIPPFPDCPHGHYLTPARIKAQHAHEWRSDVIFWNLFFIVSIVWLPGMVWLDAVTIFAAICWWFFFLLGHAIDNSTIKRLMKTGVAWDDSESLHWEKRTKRNEPWRIRIYP
jgi:hypothetical protein